MAPDGAPTRRPLETASAYRGLGLVVFPECPPTCPTCEERNKGKVPWEPSAGRHMSGWQQRGLANDAELEAWGAADARRVAAGQAPANVGCRCGPGCLGDEGLIGADADGPRGLADLARHLGLAPGVLEAAITEYRQSGMFGPALGTATYLTPSGGLRVLWRVPEGHALHTAGKDAGHDGLRLAWAGSQIVLPPSTRADGDYRWLPGHSPWQVGFNAPPATVLAAMAGKGHRDLRPSGVLASGRTAAYPAATGDSGPDRDGCLADSTWLPYDLDLLRDGAPRGQRSEAVRRLELQMLAANWAPEQVVAALAGQPWVQGMRGNILEWLGADVLRAAAWRTEGAGAAAVGGGRPVSPAPAVAASAPVQASAHPGLDLRRLGEALARRLPEPGFDLDEAMAIAVADAADAWRAQAELRAAVGIAAVRARRAVLGAAAADREGAEPLDTVEAPGSADGPEAPAAPPVDVHPERDGPGIAAAAPPAARGVPSLAAATADSEGHAPWARYDRQDGGRRLRTCDGERDSAIRRGLEGIRGFLGGLAHATRSQLRLLEHCGRLLGGYDRCRREAWGRPHDLRAPERHATTGGAWLWGKQPCDGRGHEECAPFHAARELGERWGPALEEVYRPAPVAVLALSAPGWGLEETRKAAAGLLRSAKVRKALGLCAGFLAFEPGNAPGYTFNLVVPLHRAGELRTLLLKAWRTRVPCGWARMLDDLPQRCTALEALVELRVRSEQAVLLALGTGRVELGRAIDLYAVETGAFSGSDIGGQLQRLVLAPGMRTLAKDIREGRQPLEAAVGDGSGGGGIAAGPGAQGGAGTAPTTGGMGTAGAIPSNRPTEPGMPCAAGTPGGSAGPGSSAASPGGPETDDEDAGWVPCPWDPTLEMRPSRDPRKPRALPWWKLEKMAARGEVVPILHNGRLIGYRTPPPGGSRGGRTP